MEKNEKQFQCTGDCLNCRKQPNERREQWQYCAAQFTYNTMRMIGDVQESLKSMQCTIDELKTKVSAIQDNEAMVFDPNKDIAQDGDGAEIDAPI